MLVSEVLRHLLPHGPAAWYTKNFVNNWLQNSPFKTYEEKEKVVEYISTVLGQLDDLRQPFGEGPSECGVEERTIGREELARYNAHCLFLSYEDFGCRSYRLERVSGQA